MSHDKSSFKGEAYSKKSLAIGSGAAGMLELLLFHPIDTTAKRLMTYKKKVFNPGQTKEQTVNILKKVILRDAAGSGFMKAWCSLFPGLGFAFFYKVSQRIYKFGGQPLANDYVNKIWGAKLRARFGDRQGRPLTHAISGMLIGMGEVVILPFDVLKIKKQTNPEAFTGRSILDIVLKENTKLYTGLCTTALRNAFGSAALFGAAVCVKEYVFKIEDFKKASLFQQFASSTIGAFASIAVSSPLDVVKTRIQHVKFGTPVTGRQVFMEIVQKEGFSSFFKGLIPKTAMVGPKLIFSMTFAQWFTQILAQRGI
eukprot:TRINITY_DN1158_c0_g1_i1.p1 TRINITY_DN1158_c0_g1~~TRINITY_DN1158_c0_g1_i1.p1  ORF type:complete len:312 (-),score=57.08 TRINITY_DN1158_c0_g1_i1:309-1244(-)